MSYDSPRSEAPPGDRVMNREGQTAMSGLSADAVEVENRVQFGPIVAGILTAIATLLILTVHWIGGWQFGPRTA